MASEENASPFNIQRLKPPAAAFCLTMVISMVSSGVAPVPPARPKRVQSQRNAWGFTHCAAPVRFPYSTTTPIPWRRSSSDRSPSVQTPGCVISTIAETRSRHACEPHTWTGSRRSRPFHARGSAARRGSAAWRARPRRRPANRSPPCALLLDKECAGSFFSSLHTSRRSSTSGRAWPSARQRREGLVEHLVRAQLRREDALHHETLDERMQDAHEYVGRHRQFARRERAQPFGAELVAVLRDLVDAQP